MKGKIAVLIIVLTLMLSPVYAQLGTQSFPSANSHGNIAAEANLELAQTTFSNPGMMPDNPLYFIKRMGENLRLMFAFNSADRTQLHLEFAKTRLAEAKTLINENKTEKARQAIGDFDKEINMINITKGIGSNVSVIAKSDDILGKSALVLGLVLENAPEEAKPAIEHALNSSIEKKIRVENEGNENKDETEMRKEITEKKKHLIENIRKTIERDEAHEESKRTACIQVVTSARNPETDEVREFPTTCNVPAGWEKVEKTMEIKPIKTENPEEVEKDNNVAESTIMPPAQPTPTIPGNPTITLPEVKIEY